jgi:hypothetical protein
MTKTINSRYQPQAATESRPTMISPLRRAAPGQFRPLQQGEIRQRLGLVDGAGVRVKGQIMPPFTEMIWPLM